VLIPIVHNAETQGAVLSYCEELAKSLRSVHYHGLPLQVIVDKRDLRGGEKTWGWIKKGIPLRLEIGPREMEAEQFALARRDKPHKETTSVRKGELPHRIPQILDEVQKALRFRNQHTVKIDKKSDFNDFFTGSGDEIHGGFALCHWNGDPAIEAKVKEDLNVTIR